MIDQVKDIANIVFFVTMSVIALLSYLQARKTIFSPIKTEIFKLQIETFNKVISFFNRTGQSSFDELFDFHGLFEFNAERMQRTYTNLFFL